MVSRYKLFYTKNEWNPDWLGLNSSFSSIYLKRVKYQSFENISKYW